MRVQVDSLDRTEATAIDRVDRLLLSEAESFENVPLWKRQLRGGDLVRIEEQGAAQ